MEEAERRELFPEMAESKGVHGTEGNLRQGGEPDTSPWDES